MARLFFTLVTISKGFHCYVKNSQNKINLMYFSGTTHYNPPSPLSPSTPPPLPLLPLLDNPNPTPNKGFCILTAPKRKILFQNIFDFKLTTSLPALKSENSLRNLCKNDSDNFKFTIRQIVYTLKKLQPNQSELLYI